MYLWGSISINNLRGNILKIELSPPPPQPGDKKKEKKRNIWKRGGGDIDYKTKKVLGLE